MSARRDGQFNREFLCRLYLAAVPELAPHGLALGSPGMVFGQHLLVPGITSYISGLDPKERVSAIVMRLGGVTRADTASGIVPCRAGQVETEPAYLRPVDIRPTDQPDFRCRPDWRYQPHRY